MKDYVCTCSTVVTSANFEEHTREGDVMRTYYETLSSLNWYESELERAKQGFLKGIDDMISKSVCECGTEKHGFASHSTWCAKYKKVNI